MLNVPVTIINHFKKSFKYIKFIIYALPLLYQLLDIFSKKILSMVCNAYISQILLIPSIIILLLSSVLFAQTYNNSDKITGFAESNTLTYSNFISGNFRTQYQGRWADGQDDHDMYEYLNFKTKDFFDNKVSIAGSGRLSEDFDGHEPKSGAFRDILDSYDRNYNGRVYYLYADIKNPVIDKSSLRVGRQYQYSVETILFDGAKYEQKIGTVDSYVFGGLRVSQYSKAPTSILWQGVGYLSDRLWIPVQTWTMSVLSMIILSMTK